MADSDANAIHAARKDWTRTHRATYLASGGADGHVMDLRDVGGPRFGTHCLIRYRGRRSGRMLITPLCYVAVGGEVVICASRGGADHHPAWYLNLTAAETVDVQIATQAWRATWRQPEGAEREKVWGLLVDAFPFYADYEASTDRVIPLVMLSAGDDIPVFRAEDADATRPT